MRSNHAPDILRAFWAETINDAPGSSTAVRRLKDRYSEWCAAYDMLPVPDRVFRAYVVAQGYGQSRTTIKGRNTRAWRGFALIPLAVGANLSRLFASELTACESVGR